MFKVCIAGGRDFNNYELLKSTMDKILENKILAKEQIIIVSGGARGTDKLGEQYALERGFKIEQYLPDWNLHGRSAGMRRNKLLIANSDVSCIFWDGQSKGSANTIVLAKQSGKPYRIIRY